MRAGRIDLVTIVVAVEYGQLFRRHNSRQVLRSKAVIISCSALFLGAAAAEAGHLRYGTRRDRTCTAHGTQPSAFGRCPLRLLHYY